MTEVKNAVISEVQIGFTENQSLTAWVVVNFGMAKQGFGGLDLSNNNVAADFITKVLKVVGVGTVEQLNDKAVRVEHDQTKIYRLGNFINNTWLSIDTLEITEEQSNVDETQTGNSETQTPNQTKEVVVDSEGKKQHSLNAEPGVIGAELS